MGTMGGVRMGWGVCENCGMDGGSLGRAGMGLGLGSLGTVRMGLGISGHRGDGFGGPWAQRDGFGIFGDSEDGFGGSLGTVGWVWGWGIFGQGWDVVG